MKIGNVNRPQSIFLVIFLAVLATAVVIVCAWFDRVGRSAGPELPVYAYAAAVEREDLDGALGQLVPELRDAAAPFVAWELGNRYTILESVVRTTSIIDRLFHIDRQTRVVAIMEIESTGQQPWRATEELPVQQIDGRWYLLKVPLRQS